MQCLLLINLPQFMWIPKTSFLVWTFLAVSFSKPSLVSYSCSFRTNLHGIIQKLQTSPIPQTSFLVGTFFDASYSKRAVVLCHVFVLERLCICFIKDRILSVFTLLPVGLHYHKLHAQRQISDIYLIDILPHHLYQFMYTECTLAI